MPTKIHTIVTHHEPHPDELLAIILLRLFGRLLFPGIETAKIIFWDSGSETPDKQSAADWLARGFLLVGVGGGLFDEHPTLDAERKKGDCAATLVAKYLGIFGERWLARLLDAIADEDEHAGSGILDITSISKRSYALHSDQPEKVMARVMADLEDIVHSERHVWVSSKKRFDASAKVELITGADGHPIRIGVITSGDRFMSRYALHTEGGNCQILIQKHPRRGGVQIFSKQGEGLNFIEVVRLIRQNERLANGLPALSDRATLAREGTVEGANCWFFHEKGQMLLNQSNTSPGKPATKLLLSKVLELAKLGLQTPFDRAA